MNDALQQAADALWQAEHSGTPCAPLRERIAALGGDPLAAAYAIQNLNTQRKLASGSRLVGRKIGLTSVAVQKQLGVDSPDFGMLFADMAFGDGEEIPLARTMQAKVEAEIALVLERDLPHERNTVPTCCAPPPSRCRPSKSSAAASPTGTSV